MLQHIQYSDIAMAAATQVSHERCALLLPLQSHRPDAVPPRSDRVIPRDKPLAGDTR